MSKAQVDIISEHMNDYYSVDDSRPEIEGLFVGKGVPSMFGAQYNYSNTAIRPEMMLSISDISDPA